MTFNPPAGFQSGYSFGIYALLGGGLLAGLLFFFALMEGLDHYRRATAPMVLWALAAGLVYLIGPVLWVLRILPEFKWAALLGVALTVGVLVAGMVRIKKIPQERFRSEIKIGG